MSIELSNVSDLQKAEEVQQGSKALILHVLPLCLLSMNAQVTVDLPWVFITQIVLRTFYFSSTFFEMLAKFVTGSNQPDYKVRIWVFVIIICHFVLHCIFIIHNINEYWEIPFVEIFNYYNPKSILLQCIYIPQQCDLINPHYYRMHYHLKI